MKKEKEYLKIQMDKIINLEQEFCQLLAKEQGKEQEQK